MDFMRASDYGPAAKAQLGRIFVDGFYQWLRYISKDKNKLSNVFRHMFNLEFFHVAVIDGEIAGMASCTDGTAPAVTLDCREFRTHLGSLRGTIAYRLSKRVLEEMSYPFEMEKDMGLIEYVATSEKHRGKGVAAALLSHIAGTDAYGTYVLEVADTNSVAVRLYEKLGYTEFARVRDKHKRWSGVNYYRCMRYLKPAS